MDTNVAGLNKVVCIGTLEDEGKTVTIANDTNTWEETITEGIASFLIPSIPAPAKTPYVITLGENDYTRTIQLGFGDSVVIVLDEDHEPADKGYVDAEVTEHIYTLPTADASTKGGVKVPSGAGVYMDGQNLRLNVATRSTKGGIIVGDGLVVDSSGKVSIKEFGLASTHTFTLNNPKTFAEGGGIATLRIPWTSDFSQEKAKRRLFEIVMPSTIYLGFSNMAVVSQRVGSSTGLDVDVMYFNNTGDIVTMTGGSIDFLDFN